MRFPTVATRATGMGWEVSTAASEVANGKVPMDADWAPSRRTATFSPLAAFRSTERTALVGWISTRAGSLGAAARTKRGESPALEKTV